MQFEMDWESIVLDGSPDGHEKYRRHLLAG